MVKLAFTLALLFNCSTLFSQIAIPDATPVTENFDGMGSSGTAALPANWKFSPAGAAAPTYAAGGNFTAVNQQASGGTPATGARYNWGQSAGIDRALGIMTSGSYASPNSIMVWYQNTNASNLTDLTVSYDLERYRINTAAASVQFYYSTDGSTWTAVAAGDIAAGTIGSGASAYTFATPTVFNSSTNPFTITGLNIPTNGDIYLRWNLNTTGSNSQGIGIDNVSVTAGYVACTPATAPTTNASGLVFSTIGCNSMTVSWTNGNGANRIVVAKAGSAITGSPTDNTAYAANSVFGSGGTIAANEYVIYNGTGSSVTITNLTASTTYHFAVFEYNGTGGCQAYQISGELIGSQITNACAICPHMTGAIINACNGACSEGDNEMLFFNSEDFSIPVAPANIIVRYENVSPATVNYTESFTTNAAAITAFNTTAGCGTLFFDASAVGTIPPNSIFIIVKHTTCYGFDFSAFCGLGPIYVLFSTDASWVAGGNFVNGAAAGVLRYFRTDFSAIAAGCVTDYNYEPFLLSAGGDGDALSWPINGGAANQYFNDGCNPPLTVLPIEIINFQANYVSNTVELEWSTASENNNSYFTIERSENGTHFDYSGKINGAGNSNHLIHYSLNDFTAFQDVVYYRLSSTDFNGVKTIYKTIALRKPSENSSLLIYPNPSQGNFTISIEKNILPNTVIKIVNQLGEIVFEEIIQEEGKLFNYSIEHLPSGIYHVVLENEFELIQGKFIKQ